ncbi:hypothetical protein [Pseudokordiimonas caeni]|uniref:hypothetical protein n=1 Tax=Pseudokordiimonas caeni TaxID=2997908 RepID=UPI0028110034|nr:hypothetical protein [Pseudokordiimonas caeni]
MAELEHWDWSARRGPRGNLREAVAVFDSEADMQEAVDELESHGFSNAAMSRPASPEEITAALRHEVKSVKELEDDSAVPREAYIDKDSRSSALLVLVLIPFYVLVLVGVGLAVSQGIGTWETVGLVVFMGAIGAVGGGYFSLKLFRRMQGRMALERAIGGLLLWVRIGSREQEAKAMQILARHRARDLHLHGPAFSA